MDAVYSVPVRGRHYPKIQPTRAEQAAREFPELSLNPWQEEDERKNEKKEQKVGCKMDDKQKDAAQNKDRMNERRLQSLLSGSGVFF